MPDTPGQRDVIRERLLTLLAERSYHYRPETLDTVDRCRQAGHEVPAVVVLVDREEGGLDRLRSGVRGVPCTAIFTRADLDDRVQRGRNAAPPA